MDWLEQQLHNTPTPETIVHLGAGLCGELPGWQKTGAGRIILVEPNPEMLPELRRRTSEHAAVEIIAAAIAEKAGRGALRLFNFPLMSSLREPTGLYQILPGLQQTGRATVDLIPVDQLLKQLEINDQTSNWLFIDTPGEEATIIDQLKRSGRLQEFSRIFLSAGVEPLYNGAKAAHELVSILQSHGFEPIGQPDPTDADWPRHHLRLDHMALECKRLRAELAEYKRLEAEHKADLLAAAKALDTVKQLLAETEKDYQIQLEASRNELTVLQQSSNSRIQDLESKLAKREKALADAEREKKQTDEQHQAELEATQNELNTLQQSGTSRIQELEEQLEQINSKFARTEKQNGELQKQLEGATARVTELESRLALSRHELRRAEGQIETVKDLLLRESIL